LLVWTPNLLFSALKKIFGVVAAIELKPGKLKLNKKELI
jgi:hypothetical protein